MTMREQEAAARLDDVSTFGLDTIALIRAGDQAIPNALLHEYTTSPAISIGAGRRDESRWIAWENRPAR
jgi:hypothetical protein